MKKLQLILVAFFAIFVGSCSNNEHLMEQPEELAFLSISSDRVSISELNQNELAVVFKSLNRMKLAHRSNGALELITKTGGQVNVSENVYRIVLDLITRSNSSLGKSSRNLSTRNEDVEFSTVSDPKKDSMERVNTVSIDYVANTVCSMINCPYWIAKGRLEVSYGKKGVKRSELLEALRLFGDWHQVPNTGYFEIRPFETRAVAFVDGAVLEYPGSGNLVSVLSYNALDNAVGIRDVNHIEGGGATLRVFGRERVGEIYILNREYNNW